MTKKIFIAFFFIATFTCSYAQSRLEQLFDDGWKFHKGDIKGAEKSSFKDLKWRTIDLPHDWSIEALPNQKPDEVVGPFDKSSIGTTATAYTIGGTSWYRKTFTLDSNANYTNTIINFDGVYMNSEVWINGKKVGVHPYGYSAFHYDITKFLKPAGEKNVIAVKVRNEGKNSRWYSGSGIYRHVHLIRTQPIHIAHNGVYVTTKNIIDDMAVIKVASTLDNQSKMSANVKLSMTICSPTDEVVQTVETPIKNVAKGSSEFVQTITIARPALWSLETPNLYKIKVTVWVNGKETDNVTTTFGIRTIEFNAQEGFLLNGVSVLLKGGCLHHDNGFLGSATIDRAEERKVELLKAYGYNAVRTAHNPPSQQFLDACDRVGIVVIDELFDMWQRKKNPHDYHLYFDEWWPSDLASIVMRDRNHPSVIIWSIGNEINERVAPSGHALRKLLVAEVKKFDTSRPVSEGICTFWDHPNTDWAVTAEAFAALDVACYNYNWRQYNADHAAFPERVMLSTETYPNEAYDNWNQIANNPWVVGEFVWTGMDHLGENGVGNASWIGGTSKQGKGNAQFGGGMLRTWPWFVNNSGDIDLCGFKKPQMYYKDVVWGDSKLEMAVHEPAPEEGARERVSYWGWPQEHQSWSWNGHEGKVLDVRVFSSYPVVRLELNGKVIGEQVAGHSVKHIATFKVPYEAGVLRAVALENGIVVASKEFKTVGKPTKVKLTVDRAQIRNDRNDLAYVTVEVVDCQGNLIPSANIPIKLSVSGAGEIAGSGNSCPNDQESFNSPICKSYCGKALIILRPLMNKSTGTITLMAEAEGLTAGKLEVTVK